MTKNPHVLGVYFDEILISYRKLPISASQAGYGTTLLQIFEEWRRGTIRVLVSFQLIPIDS
jgi:hypothetical protein